MAKIERKYLAHYIDANVGGEFTSYVRLGKDLETYAEELNPQVTIQRNLKGNPSVIMDGYQVQSTVEPYYAEYGSLLFDVLSNIANNRITDDSCKTTKVDVLLNEDGTQVWAYREDVWIVPVSIGGDTSGVQIPFNVYCAGDRVYGTFDSVNKTFIETGEEPSVSPFTTLSAFHNGVYSAPEGKGYSQVTVSVPTGPIELTSLSVDQNGEYLSPEGFAYNQVFVSLPNTLKAVIERSVSGAIYDSEVENVGSCAFAFCRNLEEISFPNCTFLADSVFSSCRNLRIANLPMCSQVGYAAFSGCYSLSSVSVTSCQSISDYAFFGCSKLNAISIPNCSAFGSNAFRACGLESIYGPLVELGGASTFYGAGSLSTVNLPKLSNVNFSMFYSCSKLVDISVPLAQRVGDNAFAYCIKLQNISLPNCSYIAYSAFSRCYNLVSLYLMSTSMVSLSSTVAQTFGSTPIYNYSTSAGGWGTIYVPASLLTAYQTDAKWSVISSRFSGI